VQGEGVSGATDIWQGYKVKGWLSRGVVEWGAAWLSRKREKMLRGGQVGLLCEGAAV
jgi:hypothetical protein